MLFQSVLQYTLKYMKQDTENIMTIKVNYPQEELN